MKGSVEAHQVMRRSTRELDVRRRVSSISFPGLGESVWGNGLKPAMRLENSVTVHARATVLKGLASWRADCGDVANCKLTK